MKIHLWKFVKTQCKRANLKLGIKDLPSKQKTKHLKLMS